MNFICHMFLAPCSNSSPRFWLLKGLPGWQAVGQGVHSLNSVTTQSFLQGRRHGRTASGRRDSGHLRTQTRIKQNKNFKLWRKILFLRLPHGCEDTAIAKTPLLARASLIFLFTCATQLSLVHFKDEQKIILSFKNGELGLMTTG